jgi:cytochrome b
MSKKIDWLLEKAISLKLLITKGGSRGDVPGWVLVVLMTTALVTGIWSIAAPKLTTILRNSLDAMSGIK